MAEYKKDLEALAIAAIIVKCLSKAVPRSTVLHPLGFELQFLRFLGKYPRTHDQLYSRFKNKLADRLSNTPSSQSSQ